MVRTLAAAICAFLIGISSGAAHKGVHPEADQDFLNQVDELMRVIASADPAGESADALYDLGKTLTQVTELLNRDLASQGGNPSDQSSVLIEDLKTRGIELQFSEAAKRYESYLRPFKEYLALSPDGSRRADAMFRVLYGGFYDSFGNDPMELLDMDWTGLMDQIEMAESFLSLYPDHGDREEAQFILAVDYARAAREASGEETTQSFRERAHAALTAFRETYPDSLRALAAQVLINRLAQAD